MNLAVQKQLWDQILYKSPVGPKNGVKLKFFGENPDFDQKSNILGLF